MLIPMLIALIESSPIDIAAELVQERLQRLDRLVINYNWRAYKAPRDSTWIDQSTWVERRQWEGGHDMRLTIVRPNALNESLSPFPQSNMDAMAESAFDGAFTQRLDTPGNSGRIHYSSVPWSVQNGRFAWLPVLQAFDIHLQDSPTSQLNVYSLLQNPHCMFESIDDGEWTFRCTLTQATGIEYRFRFSIDGSGLPRSITTTIGNPNTEISEFVWEQRVLSVMVVNDATLPREIAIAIDNPNTHLPYRGVHLFTVLDCQRKPELTADDCRIVPATESAIVTVVDRDRLEHRTWYDAAGKIDHVDESYGPEPLDPNVAVASAAQLRLRPWIPVASATAGLLAATFVSLICWRRSGAGYAIA